MRFRRHSRGKTNADSIRASTYLQWQTSECPLQIAPGPRRRHSAAAQSSRSGGAPQRGGHLEWHGGSSRRLIAFLAGSSRQRRRTPVHNWAMALQRRRSPVGSRWRPARSRGQHLAHWRRDSSTGLWRFDAASLKPAGARVRPPLAEQRRAKRHWSSKRLVHRRQRPVASVRRVAVAAPAARGECMRSGEHDV